MPPTNSTFRGPCPRVRTRIGRPWTDLPTTLQPSPTVGGAGVVAVVGGIGGGVACPDVGVAEAGAEVLTAVRSTTGELQPGAVRPVATTSSRTAAPRRAVSMP